MSIATHAFITPCYPADFERLKLQCESMDRMAQGNWRHYILVADHDLDQFKEFNGGRRSVMKESVLLPKWLKPIRKPFSKSKSWIWIRMNLGKPLWPMSGWHVQQLRKMLIARHIEEPNLVFADSDSFFIRPFSLDRFMHDGKLRLYRKPGAIGAAKFPSKHMQWVKQSGSVLGIAPEDFPANDYIENLVSWRREYAIAMIDHIEKTARCDLVSAMGKYRTFSEYQIYGSFIDRVLRPTDQPGDSRQLTQTYWGAGELVSQSMDGFIHGLDDHQIAIGVQSFTQTSIDLLRQTYRGMAAKLR